MRTVARTINALMESLNLAHSEHQEADLEHPDFTGGHLLTG